MENSNKLTERLNEMKTVANNGFWFRDTRHYWAEASLPLAYAVACGEVVCKSSEKARILCNRPGLLEAE